ncbi:hypothetical protein Noda2021_10370 [Candidatus Dependentiae bacterium Noda2021]|nr:hypothetical protein Noda2021_10370 [Candidatus Dependentiae bacterium Noda2021]
MYYLVTVVDQVITGWLWILSWGQSRWLVGFKKPSIIVLCIMGITPFVVLHSKSVHSLKRAILLFSFLFITIIVYLKYIQMPRVEYSCLDNRSMPVHCVYHGDVTLVIPRLSGRSEEAISKWVDYTLMPFLIKQTGMMRVTHLIILESNPKKVELFLSVATKSIAVDHCYGMYTSLKNVKGMSVINGNFVFLLGRYAQLAVEQVPGKNGYIPAQILLTIDNEVTTLYSPKLRSPHHNMQKRSRNYESQKSFAYRCA